MTKEILMMPTTTPILTRGLSAIADAAQLPDGVRNALRNGPTSPSKNARESEERFWDAAAAADRRGDLAARAPALVPEGAFDVIELVVTSAPDVRTGLRALGRAADALHGVAMFELVERANQSATLVYRTPHARGTPGGALAAEVAMTSIVELLRRATGDRTLAPTFVMLSGEPHSRVETLAENLGCPVKTGAALDRLELDASLVGRQVVTAEPRLFALALRVADLERERVLTRHTALAARAALEGLVTAESSEDAPIHALAKTLEMRPRTLQARLAREKTTLRALVDDARRIAADRLLLSGASPSEVQRALRYTDAGSFRRACRRWWRSGPLARRKALSGTSEPGVENDDTDTDADA